MALDDLLGRLIGDDVSDIHFKANRPPLIRQNGSLVNAPGFPALSADDCMKIAMGMLAIVIGLGFYEWDGWFFWAFMLAFAIGVKHPDTPDSVTPLDPLRKRAAWATIGIFILTFIPVPLTVVQGTPSDSGPSLEERYTPEPRRVPPPEGLLPARGNDGIDGSEDPTSL